VIFLGIDNIHGMRDSLIKMRDFLDTNGASSSDGSSSLLVCKVPVQWCQI
jgi:myotubularin-related protein 1/2